MMQVRRSRQLSRAAPTTRLYKPRSGAVVAAVLATLMIGSTGCSDDESATPSGTPGSSSTGGGGAGGAGGGAPGGSGGGGGGGTGGVFEPDVTEATEASTPFDAAPDPEGTTIYFTADGPNGPGVF